jgi:LPS-assembly protein
VSRIGFLLLAAAIAAGAPLPMALTPAYAQGAPAPAPAPALGGGEIARDQPVYYQADSATYDRDSAIVTLDGHVEIWQDDKVLRADKVTLDRNSGVAAAEGHVSIVQPDGQVLFADYAELSQGMADGVLRDMSARLPQNGRLVANGARRTGGEINELSRAVYSTCNLCAANPDHAPLWEIRARSAVQDVANKRIEYHDAVIDLYGVPVAWFPYLTHPDPSEKRASGILVPSIGISKHLGPFVEVPYYLVIDKSTDATITPILAADKGPAVAGQYRQRFNNGTLNINASAGYDLGGAQGHLFGKGVFAIDDTWRWGFDINRASSAAYMRDFRISGLNPLLTSQVYLEGFGQGAYSRLDMRAYQGLSSSIVAAKLPFVLPRYEYSFFGEPDLLGGRIALDAGAFNVLRGDGTKTQRVSLSANWDRRLTGFVGDVWKLTLHADSAAYTAQDLDKQPNFYGTTRDVATDQAMPTAALEVRWPLQRDAGDWGSQLIEPIVQLVAAPNSMNYLHSVVPNEDALDTDFTDANLFALNRHSGIDRLEGGMRANVALHAAWTFQGGSVLDGMVGQSYRTRADSSFQQGTGLNKATSDIVSHVSFSPNQYVDLTSRQRFDRRTFNVTFADAVVAAGPSWLRMTAGYLYSSTNPYFYYDTPPTGVLPGPPRNEVSLGANTHFGRWRLSGDARQDVRTRKLVSVSVGGGYEDECFIFDLRFFRRYTSIANDHGDTAVLFQITLKTVGEFGFHAL